MQGKKIHKYFKFMWMHNDFQRRGTHTFKTEEEI